MEQMKEKLLELEETINKTGHDKNEKDSLPYEQHQYPMKGHTSYLLVAIAPSLHFKSPF